MQGDLRRSIVCCHVASGELPLLCATRDEPVNAADSGWQFHCNVHDHSTGEHWAEVWAVADVLAQEPGLGEWMDAPIGTRLIRETPDRTWHADEA